MSSSKKNFGSLKENDSVFVKKSDSLRRSAFSKKNFSLNKHAFIKSDSSPKEKKFFVSFLKIVVLLLVVLCFVLIYFVFFLSSSISELTLTHNEFVDASINREKELFLVLMDLNKEKNELITNLNNLEKNYSLLLTKASSLESSYSNLKEEANQTISKIVDYEKQIQSSLEWFNNNSFLDPKNSRVINSLKSNCLEKTRNACEINLGCFHLVNSEFLNYSYKDDLLTSGVIDKLQSLEEFVNNKGGDCEDFALFFKAEYNSLTSSCSSLSLFGWERKKGEKFWANTNQSWYLSNAKKKFLLKENVFPLIVCGNIFDPQTQKINGHCVIAFAPKKIDSINDINYLLKAELIEPQSGEYLGVIGGDSGVFLRSTNPHETSFINTLITDNDFFLFTNNEWVNYTVFGEELSLHKQKIINLLN